MKARGLMFELNSVRNLMTDTMNMAQDPSLSNAFYLGIQAQMTAQRLRQMPQTMASLGQGVWGAASQLGAFAFTPIGALTVGATAAAVVVGSLVLADYQRRQMFEEWQKAQAQIAKRQGEIP